jgi:hypothetical protein
MIPGWVVKTKGPGLYWAVSESLFRILTSSWRASKHADQISQNLYESFLRTWISYQKPKTLCTCLLSLWSTWDSISCTAGWEISVFQYLVHQTGIEKETGETNMRLSVRSATSLIRSSLIHRANCYSTQFRSAADSDCGPLFAAMNSQGSLFPQSAGWPRSCGAKMPRCLWNMPGVQPASYSEEIGVVVRRSPLLICFSSRGTEPFVYILRTHLTAEAWTTTHIIV